LGQDSSRAFVGGVDAATNLPIGELPALVGGVCAYLVEFGALQQQLEDLGDLLLKQGFVGLGH
jgi:hypothetical protein